MARARNIKPSFFQNDALGELPALARLLFIGMWTISDFKGCLEFRPKRIKAQLLPYDDCDVEELTINLDKSGFVSIYSVTGSKYIKIINFEKHQNPHKNEKESGSEIPDITKKDNEINDLTEDGTTRDKNGTDRADSLFLIPDSLNLIPDPIEKVNPIVPAKAVTASSEAQSVFDYWKKKRGYQRAKLDAKRLKAINARLKDGYSVEDLCKAIDGIERSPHHMGQNDRRTVYDDIELICRDGPRVDGFIKLASTEPGIDPRLQHQIDVLNDWMNQP